MGETPLSMVLKIGFMDICQIRGYMFHKHLSQNYVIVEAATKECPDIVLQLCTTSNTLIDANTSGPT